METTVLSRIYYSVEETDEEGGIGDFAGKKFMWLMHNDTYVEVCFESGESIRLENTQEGWSEFLVWALMVTKTL